MGRDAGWLAASSALGKTGEDDAPHFIGLPEVPVDEDLYLNHMEEAYRRRGFAVAVVAENASGPGDLWAARGSPSTWTTSATSIMRGPAGIWPSL